MIPKIAEGGASFTGAGAYYLGAGRAALLEEAAGGICAYMLGEGKSAHKLIDGRVGLTRLNNLSADDAAEGFASMQATFERYQELKRGAKGRPLKDPVYSYSLSWAVDERPSDEVMIAAAEETLALLGMADHQSIFVSHIDKAYDHIHVVVNRIKPDMSGVTSKSMDRLKLSRWAEGYEREHGKIYCAERVRNNALRRDGFLAKDLNSKSRQEIEAERRAAWPVLKRLYRAEQAVIAQMQQAGVSELTGKHRQEIEQLFASVNAKADAACDEVLQHYRPAFALSYHDEKQRLAVVRKLGASKAALATYVADNAHWLLDDRTDGGPQFAALSVSSEALRGHIEHLGKSDRCVIGRQQKADLSAAVETVWSAAHRPLQALLEQQSDEHPVETDHAPRGSEESFELESPFDLALSVRPDLGRRVAVAERGAKRIGQERGEARAILQQHGLVLKPQRGGYEISGAQDFREIISRPFLRDTSWLKLWLQARLDWNARVWKERQARLRERRFLDEGISLSFSMQLQRSEQVDLLGALDGALAACSKAFDVLKARLDLLPARRARDDDGAEERFSDRFSSFLRQVREAGPRRAISKAMEECRTCWQRLQEALANFLACFRPLVKRSAEVVAAFHKQWNSERDRFSTSEINGELLKDRICLALPRWLSKTLETGLGAHCSVSTWGHLKLIPNYEGLDEISLSLPSELQEERKACSALQHDVTAEIEMVSQARALQQDVETILSARALTSEEDIVQKIGRVQREIERLVRAGFNLQPYVSQHDRISLENRRQVGVDQLNQLREQERLRSEQLRLAAVEHLRSKGRAILNEAGNLGPKSLIERIESFRDKLREAEIQHRGMKKALPNGLLERLDELQAGADKRIRLAELSGSVSAAILVLKEACNGQTDDAVMRAHSVVELRIGMLEGAGGQLSPSQLEILAQLKPLAIAANQRIEATRYSSGPSLGM